MKFLQDQGAENIVILNLSPPGLAPGVRQVSKLLPHHLAGLGTLIASLVSGDPKLGSVSTLINRKHWKTSKRVHVGF